MVAERLTEVRTRVAAAATRVGRDPAEVTLVAVSKGQPVSTIEAAYAAGHRDFGENRAQELVAKAPGLPSDIRWHFVGSLQTKKAKLVRPSTHLLHSLDRPKLVAAWARGAQSPPPALVQVNLAAEPQKHGVDVTDLPRLLELAGTEGIEVRGLMLIPPVPAAPEDSRPWFARLAELISELRPAHPRLRELSMGMTDDFEVAVEEGATVIRVGRAIFGPRSTGDHADERGA